ncbi:MAG: hypothetical protein O2854_09395, partial [Chloroflexi bacterium]|nr:hypothetical protein [Chloroflexota bacterium]
MMRATLVKGLALTSSRARLNCIPRNQERLATTAILAAASVTLLDPPLEPKALPSAPSRYQDPLALKILFFHGNLLPTPTGVPDTPIPKATSSGSLNAAVVAGRWQDAAMPHGSGAVITIFSTNGVLTMDWKFPDGSARVVDVIETVSDAGLRQFNPEAGGLDYFVVDAEGALGMYDDLGFFRSASV